MLKKEMITLKDFNCYNDYILSKNICMILKQFGFEKINKSTLLLLSGAITTFIEIITIKSKKYTELSGRMETNMIDLLYSLIQNNITQNSIITYITNSKIKEIKKIEINNIIELEKKERFSLLKQLNCINVPKSYIIPKKLLDAIPKNLRYFPREFTLKYSENILEKNDETIKEKNEIKKLEKKNLEGIISGNGYYDINQKNKNDKGYINLLNIYNDIVKELGHNLSQNDDNNIRTNSELFGQKFFFNRFLDDHKDNEIENKGIGDNNISNININNNNDNDLGHVLYDNVKI